MIDKIYSNYTYQNYGKITKTGAADKSAFEDIRKNYEKNGVIYEREEKKSATKRQEKIPKQESAKESREKSDYVFTFEQLKEAVRSAIAFLKETWRMIWEDTPKEEEAEDALAEQQETWEQTKAQRMEEITPKEAAPQESEVNKVLKSHDLKALNALITNNGRIKPARNSNLLTTYDKRGRIVQIESGTRERILHGDRNFIKQ